MLETLFVDLAKFTMDCVPFECPDIGPKDLRVVQLALSGYTGRRREEFRKSVLLMCLSEHIGFECREISCDSAPRATNIVAINFLTSTPTAINEPYHLLRRVSFSVLQTSKLLMTVLILIPAPSRVRCHGQSIMVVRKILPPSCRPLGSQSNCFPPSHASLMGALCFQGLQKQVNLKTTVAC